MILNNQVYQYVSKEDKDRIRVVEINEKGIYYVELDGDTAMPKKVSYAYLEAEIQGESLLLIHDPYSKMYSDKDLTIKQMSKRDEDWQIVSQYWDMYKEQLLEKSTREKVFEEITDVNNLSKLKVKRMFTRFWQRGLNKNALLPVIAGIYVGLEGPSWIGAMMALDNMISDKVEYCKKVGIDITHEQWPAQHLPEIIIADRGEFEGYSVGNIRRSKTDEKRNALFKRRK